MLNPWVPISRTLARRPQVLSGIAPGTCCPFHPSTSRSSRQTKRIPLATAIPSASRTALQLLEDILQFNPEQRPTAKEVAKRYSTSCLKEFPLSRRCSIHFSSSLPSFKSWVCSREEIPAGELLVVLREKNKGLIQCTSCFPIDWVCGLVPLPRNT